MNIHTPQSFYAVYGAGAYRPYAPAEWSETGLGAIARLWRAWRMRRIARRATLELLGLDDRLLKDIGVQRSQIGYAVLHGRGEPAEGRPFWSQS